MKESDILSSDKNHLAIMYDRDGIEVDKELQKYSSIKKEVEEFKKKKTPKTEFVNNLSINEDPSTDDVRAAFDEQKAIEQMKKNYGEIMGGDVRKVNIIVNKYLFNDVFSSFNEYSVVGGNPFITPGDQNIPRKSTFFTRLSEFIKSEKNKKTEDTYIIDVIEFFSQVKGLTKESKDTYVNRLAGYIVALKNCDVSGQTALKEKLVRDMVINKYESVLYAKNIYYVVTEEQVVNFVKKTEKGVRLTYVKNYMRAIPPEVVEKINEMNGLEIFDNYAILHYDPECKSFAETIKETKKRRDPILFGLIRGSNKLYYITDWIDEFCDLTLDKFVETLQVKKDSIKMKNTL